MARKYESAVLLTGDATGAVKAIDLTDDHLRQLNARQERNKKTTKDQGASWETLSTTLKASAAAMGLSVAGMAALGTNQLRVVAQTDRLAKSIGVQTGQLQAMQYAAQFAGLEQDKMGDILKDVADKIGDAASNGGGEAIDVINNLGLSAQKLVAISPDEQLLSIAEGLDKLGSRGQQVNALESLGNDASRLLPLLENNAAELRRLMQQGYDLNVAMTQADIDSFVDAQSAIETMGSAVQGLTNSLLIDLAPAITESVEDIREWIDEMGGMDVVVDRISTAFGVAIDVAEVLFTVWLGRRARKAIEDNIGLFTRLGTVVTSWAPSAIRQNVAYQAKLAEMAGVSRRVAVAQTALAGSVRGVSAAMGLLGGPVGTAIVAAGAIYSYREELGLVPKPAHSAAEALGELEGRIDGVTQATVNSEIAGFTAELIRLQVQASQAQDAVDNLEQTKSSPYSYGQGQQGDLLNGINEQKSALNEFNSEIEAKQNALSQLLEIQRQLNDEGSDGVVIEAQNLKSLIKTYDDQHTKLVQLRADREAISQAMADDPEHADQYRRMLGEIDGQITQLTKSTKEDTTAKREAEKVQREHQKALEDSAQAYADLYGQLSPVGKAQAEYQSTLAKLQVQVDEGTKSELEYYAAVGQAATVYNDAVAAADPYSVKLEEVVKQYDSAYLRGQQLERSLKAVNEAWRKDPANAEQYARAVAGIRDEMRQLALDSDPAAQEMARAWEEAADRIDETFSDAFAGAFDGFDDFASQLEDGFKRLLAELAYQATLRPIVVGFTSDMQTAMGMPGQSGQTLSGGVDKVLGNLGLGDMQSIGSNALDYGRSLFGGGSSAASGGLYGNVATSTGGGLYSNVATSGGGLYGNIATSGGSGFLGGSASNFSGMSGLASAGAGVAGSYVGNEAGTALFGKHANSNWGATAGGMIGTYFGGPVGAFAGSALGGMVDSAFGSDRVVGAGLVQDNSRAVDDFYGKTVDGESWSQRESQYGQFGLSNKVMMDPDELADWLDQIKDADNLLANAGNSSQKTSVRSALDGQKWSEDGGDSIAEITEARTKVIIDALKDASSDAVVDLIDSVGEITADNMSRKIPELANALKLGDLIDGLSGNVQDYALRVVHETNGNVEQTIDQLMSAIENFSVVDDTADRLGLRFNDLANNAVDAGDDLVTAAGGIDAFRTQASAYYDAFYTDAERTERQIESLNDALAGTGLSADSTRDQFRDVLESLNLNSSAGRDTYTTLMSVAGTFADVVPAAEAAADSTDELTRAEQQLADKRTDLQIELLKARGDDEAAQKLQRKEALEATDESLRSLQQQVWAAQDQAEAADAAAEAADAAAEAQERYADALASSRGYLEGAFRDIGSYIDQLNATDGGLASPGDQLASASSAFREQYDLALSGDRDALDSITQYADRFIDAQQGWSGSGGETSSVVDRIETMLAALPDQLTPEQFLADEFSGALAGQTKDLIGAIDLNGDGVRSAVEAEISANLDATSALSSKLVEQMQLNGQRALTQSDIRSALGVTESRAAEILSSLDRNGDGIVTATEIETSKTRESLIEALRDRFGELGDTVLTVDQIRAELNGKASASDIAAVVSQLDANGDGIVTATELSAAEQTSSLVGTLRDRFGDLAGRVLTADQVRKALAGKASDAQIEAVIRSIDSNGDGVITLAEAQRQATSGLPGAIAASLGPLFDSLDLNVDGFLTFDEMREALNGIATDDQLRAIFQALDTNGDGQISRLEALRDSTDRTGDNTSDLSGLGGKTLGQIGSMNNHIEKDWREGITQRQRLTDMLDIMEDSLGSQFRSWGESDNRHITKMWRETISIDTQTQRTADFLKRMYESDWINGSHATGLARVPFDGYIAELHEGEGVLTAEQNRLWQALGESGPATLQPLVMAPPSVSPSSGAGSMEQLLRDNNRLMRQNVELMQRLEQHGAAGVRVSSEAGRRQIAATEQGNRSLARLESESRLEKTRA
ncbi:EF-hand domain-containing protein [Salinicola halophyticus]|uniref:EF-hand domain-containing protein n=1 Tax=Salinicola halophyticus TaxID=1808881 RepID=UPI003F46457F